MSTVRDGLGFGVRNVHSEGGYYRPHEYWVGLRRQSSDDVWKWEDGSPRWTARTLVGQPLWSKTDVCLWEDGWQARWRETACEGSAKGSFVCSKYTSPSLPLTTVFGTTCEGQAEVAGKCFLLIPAVLLGAEGARHACEEWGGDLASITTDLERTTVQSIFSTYGISGDAWIGLHSLHYRHFWSWSDHSPWDARVMPPPPSSSFDTSTTRDVECATIDESGWWAPANCKTRVPNVLCSRSSVPTPPPPAEVCDGIVEDGKCWTQLQIPMRYDTAELACYQLGASLATVASESEVLLARAIGGGWIGLRSWNGTWAWEDETAYSVTDWDQCDETSWPDKRGNLVCSDCKVLVNNFDSEYLTCDGYCSSIGLDCVGGWEERADSCEVESGLGCSTTRQTPDAICECAPPAPPSDPSLSVQGECVTASPTGWISADCSSVEAKAICSRTLPPPVCNEDQLWCAAQLAGSAQIVPSSCSCGCCFYFDGVDRKLRRIGTCAPSCSRLAFRGQGIAELDSVVFEGLSHVRVLDLSKNEIVSLGGGVLDGLKGLAVLYLDHNRITELSGAPFTKLRMLTELDLRKNSVRLLGEDAFSNQTSLLAIDLSKNRMRKIEDGALNDLDNLLFLSLNENELRDSARQLADLSSVVSLHLDRNSFSVLESDEGTAPFLRHLHLDWNQIIQVSPGVFNSSKQLQTLYLRANELSTMEHNVLGSLTSLEWVDILMNPLACQPVFPPSVSTFGVDASVATMAYCLQPGCNSGSLGSRMVNTGQIEYGGPNSIGDRVIMMSILNAMYVVRRDLKDALDATNLELELYTDGGDGLRCWCTPITNCFKPATPTCKLPGKAGNPCTDCLEGFWCPGNNESNSCLEGYTSPRGSQEEAACTDRDECAEMVDSCEQLCNNTDGSFECSCNAGYLLNFDGFLCSDIDECLTTPCDGNASCVNTDGSFDCTCYPGFESADAGVTCTLLCPQPCDRENGVCVNVSSRTFECGCAGGFELQSDGITCIDVDECSDQTTNDCDADHGSCENTAGSFTCRCESGFESNVSFAFGVRCHDVDECLRAEYCDLVKAECTNFDGGFTCSCLVGYESNDGAVTCLNVDECATSLDACGDPASSGCTDTDGSFECFTCDEGYLFGVTVDGFLCSDIDECLTAPCDENATCANTNGSFSCACYPGFESDDEGVTCTLLCPQPCDRENGVCVNASGTFVCGCAETFNLQSDGLTCAGLDECANSTTNTCDPLYAECRDTAGSFFCECEPGYTSTDDGVTCRPGCSSGWAGVCPEHFSLVGGECWKPSAGMLEYDAAVNDCDIEGGGLGVESAREMGKRSGWIATPKSAAEEEILRDFTTKWHEVGGRPEPSASDDRLETQYAYIGLYDYAGGNTRESYLRHDGKSPTYVSPRLCGSPGSADACSSGNTAVALGWATDSRLSGWEPWEIKGWFDWSPSGHLAILAYTCAMPPTCLACPENYWCPGGDAVNRCPDNTTSPAGSSSVDECYPVAPSPAVDECASELTNNCDAAHAECIDTDESFTCACNDGFFSVDGGVTCERGCGAGSFAECCSSSESCGIEYIEGECWQGFLRATSYADAEAQCGTRWLATPQSPEAEMSMTNLTGSAQWVLLGIRDVEGTNRPGASRFPNVSNYWNSGKHPTYWNWDEAAAYKSSSDKPEPDNRGGTAEDCVGKNGNQGWHDRVCNGDWGKTVFAFVCATDPACPTCPVDHWCPGGSAKHACPAGTWSLAGSSSFADCIPVCEAGFIGVPCADALCTNLQCAECGAGYTGDGLACDTDVDECASESHGCSDNGQCSNTVGGFICECSEGFEGDGVTCSDIDECAADPCHNFAACNNTAPGFSCSCNAGWDGDGFSCSDVDECVLEADNCSPNAVCINGVGNFSCTCNAGWDGDGVDCSDINECAPGVVNECDLNAECSNSPPGSYSCTCNDGWEGDGHSCSDVDECASVEDNDCDVVRGICQNEGGAFFCECKPGYRSNDGGVTCEDIDECSGPAGVCSEFANCANINGSFTCHCFSGYRSDDGGVTCTDIDECTVNSHNCDGNATCANTPGTFECLCLEGYSGDGVSCTDDDECASAGTNNCDGNATCTNKPGTFECSCLDGFSGNGETCTDDDECASETNSCDGNGTCSNVPGSFSCDCNPGYSGDGVTCTDDDECADETDDCDSNATCTNQPGTFNCDCSPGYSGDGVTCIDIDECTPSSHNCDSNATCTNEPGTFSCECNTGYSGTGVTCTDIDECNVEGKCDAENGVCTNTAGGFECVCKVGFNSSDGGVNCYEVHECDLDLDTCNAKAACSNNEGSFSCVCNQGYTGNGVNCSDIDECSNTQSPCNVNAVCTNTDGNYTCACINGYTGDGFECSDIDECSDTESPCDVNAICTNTDGNYTCACVDGYTGDGVVCILSVCAGHWVANGDTSERACVECPEGMASVTDSAFCDAPPVISDIVFLNFVFDTAQSGNVLLATLEFSDQHYPTNDTDLGGHSAALDWGCNGTFQDVSAVEVSSSTLSITYNIPDDTLSGVFPICVRVWDSSGLGAVAQSDGFVVLFVHDDAKVTGAGSFESPLGAVVPYHLTESPVMKTSFGFASKFQQGGASPEGHFKLKIKFPKGTGKGRRSDKSDDDKEGWDDFDFKSETQEWLAVPTTRLAKFQGEGYLKNDREKLYKFMVTLQDWPDKDNDRVRIKIWDAGEAGAASAVIYDNHMGVADTAWDSTLLDKGKISIFAPEGTPEYLVQEGLAYGESVGGAADGGGGLGALAAAAIAASVCLAAAVGAALVYRRVGAPSQHPEGARRRSSAVKMHVWAEFVAGKRKSVADGPEAAPFGNMDHLQYSDTSLDMQRVIARVSGDDSEHMASAVLCLDRGQSAVSRESQERLLRDPSNNSVIG